MKQRIGILFASICLLPCMVMAQSSDDMKRQYEKFRRKAKEEYRDFRHECNREYAEFMRKAWKEFQISDPIPAPKEEIVSPVVRPIDGQSVTPVSPIDERGAEPHVEVVEIPECLPQPLPVAPIGEELQPMEQFFTFTYCGTQYRVRLGDRHRFSLPYCNEKEVARVWEDCSDAKFNNVIRDCLELRIRHSLCDWAYLQMLIALGNSFFETGSNEATLLTAYLYCQSGYKMRLAHDKQKLHLLIASKHTIYEYKYFAIEGESYYLLDKETHTPLHICEASYPEEQALSLWLEKTPVLDVMYTDGRVLQDKSYPEIQTEVYANENLLRFFESYPPSEVGGNKMTYWAMYAQTPLDKEMKECLYPMLKQQLNGLTEEEAANRLLHFVQTAFEYGYDEELWGRDRSFFAEETLFYPYSDCEDRAILFSHLVRDLLDLNVALIYYPGHLATAVCFNKEVQGDYLTIDNRRFIICDPTYVNASVGESMPTVDSGNIKVTVLKRNVYDEDYTIDIESDVQIAPIEEEPKDIANTTKVKQSLFPICIDGKYGYQNAAGKIIVPCEYDSVSGYERGDKYAYIAHENGLMDLYDYRGRKLGASVLDYIPTVLWNSVTDTIDAKVLAKLGYGWDYIGFADRPSYDIESEYDFSNISGRNYENNISSITTKSGDIRHFIILKQKKNNKFGIFKFWPTYHYVDECIFIPFVYDSIAFVSGDKSKIEIFDSTIKGSRIVSLLDEKPKQSLFPICVDGKYGYQNSKGEIVVPCEYDSVSGYERGDRFPYAAYKDGKIDLYHGNPLGEYKQVFCQIEGYIPMALRWKLGRITRDDGGWVNPFAGVTLLIKLSNWDWIDWVADGDITDFDNLDMDNVSYENHVFENETDAYIIVKQISNGKWGVVPYFYSIGKEKIPFIYDSITFVKEDKSKVEVYRTDTDEREIISLVE